MDQDKYSLLFCISDRLLNILADLVQAFNGGSGEAGAHGISATAQQTPFNSNFYSNDYQRLKEKDADQPNTDRPKAYLNFVLFDDQFKLVDANSGVKQVKAEPDQLQTLSQDKMVMDKSGFLYVYTSNEGTQDVFFDNVILAVNSGPLLEETHYYPFGLTMAGLSSIALKGSNYTENRLKYNGKELQSKEFGDGSGLEWYDYGARMYDAQIGRWHVPDPLSEVSRRWSPYSYSYNNPVRFTDPDGMVPGDFLDEKGRKIASDGKDDGKVYVIKTTQKKFDSGAPSAGITKEQSDQSKETVKDYNGSFMFFEFNPTVYDNFVEIEGAQATRQAMVDIVNQDNGKGGTDPANNREYGGVIKTDGTVTQSPAGPVSDPTVNKDAHIEIASFDFQSTFHSHPSGTKSESSTGNNPLGGTTLGGSVTSGAFRNAPSNVGGDIGNSESKVNYVFSRGNGTVYIYNNTGVIATIPQANFVTPKK